MIIYFIFHFINIEILQIQKITLISNLHWTRKEIFLVQLENENIKEYFTGFESSINRSFQYLTKNHFSTFYSTTLNYIKIIIRSFHKSKNYQVIIKVEGGKIILFAYCGCKKGSSGQCAHCAAACFTNTRTLRKFKHSNNSNEMALYLATINGKY